MTPTEKAKRAEALYYDNNNITRRTLCHRIVNLEADLEDIKAENAKLRELAENLLMAFMILETPREQQKCIDRAIELRHELNVLPMETFDVSELGVKVR